MGAVDDGLPPLRDVIARHGLATRKSLGQHFLHDLNLTDRIARTAGDLSNGTVIEVGPGPGALTRSLLAAGARHVIAIEVDPRALAALNDIAAAYPGRLEIIAGDALTIDMAVLGATPRRVVANLPYNISTPLLLAWLRRAGAYSRLVLMFQKEVVDRLVAPPGTKTYGRLSVLTQWLCEARLAFNVDRKAFTPPPKVTSAIAKLTPRTRVAGDVDFKAMERVVGAAFNQRRKMLRASLKGLTATPEVLLAATGIAGTLRAENLGVADFQALARAIEKMEATP